MLEVQPLARISSIVLDNFFGKGFAKGWTFRKVRRCTGCGEIQSGCRLEDHTWVSSAKTGGVNREVQSLCKQ